MMVALPAVEEPMNCTGNCAAAGKKLLMIVALPAVLEPSKTTRPALLMMVALPAVPELKPSVLLFMMLAVPPFKMMPAPKKLMPPVRRGALMIKL
jgi:hypothetical protein